TPPLFRPPAANGARPDNARRKFFGHREPCPAENTKGRVRRYGAGTGEEGGYGAWLASKKLLKYGEFTGSGDVWGEGWEFLFCEVEKGRLKMGFRRPFLGWKGE
ncbi:hypothetical protein, partial [Neisseria meningitidis]|uniref:hypothetical protein n=2 Tax=Neisseria meningitidis TaxID=487 RepID=UPI001EE7AD94